MRQAGMENKDPLDHIMKNLSRAFKLRAQYENQPYIKKFTNDCSAVLYTKYVFQKREPDANFSLCETWISLQDVEDPLRSNASVFDKLYEGSKVV